MMFRLNWPRELARPDGRAPAELMLPESNIVLDLHGNPAEAKLHVASDGNHHMALAETVAAFLEEAPEAKDVFYMTVPPRIVLAAAEAGAVRIGNLDVPITPHVVIGPEGLLNQFVERGLLYYHAPFMQSRGNAVLVRSGNPKGIRSVADLFRPDVILALSNPVTETASFSVYEKEIGRHLGYGGVAAVLRSGRVPKSSQIHHREIPEILARGEADASIVYYHLALRYRRIFPDLFDLVPTGPMAADGHPEASNNTTAYHVGVSDNGGQFGAPFRAFLFSDAVTAIYGKHGLVRPV